MVNIKKFPRGILDQVISNSSATARAQRAPDPGLKNTIVWFFQNHEWKQRHASVKQQASSTKPHAPIFRKRQAASHKLQAPSNKLQAPSLVSVKRQASSPKQQASSLNPQASSSMMREPRKSFTVPGPRASAMINVLCGCFTWKAIWCGENFNFIPSVTFNSIVKK